MANDVLINAESLDIAIEQAAERFSIPKEALEYEKLTLDTDDLLSNVVEDEENAENVSIRVWINIDYLIEKSSELLQKLLDQMQIETEIESKHEDGLIKHKVVSQVNELLIGHNGETLESIEYLVNKMLARGGVIAPPVIVDVQNYRHKRLDFILQLARAKATQAVKNEKEVELRPMASSERKIIHAVLTQFNGVKTFSQGSDNDRHLIIAPDGTEADPTQFVNMPPRSQNNNNRRDNNRNNGNQRRDQNRRPKNSSSFQNRRTRRR